MLDLKMKETCRICGRELCGNQRRWIFHPTPKLNLQVLLSHAVGRELTRDGRGEFACSKCTFMLDRMYRFDTVIARVEALSIEKLQRLLQEKHRLRQCISGLYRKTNSEEGAVILPGDNDGSGDGMVDISGLTHAKYCALLQDDLVYSLYESWADDGLECQHHHHPQSSAGPESEVTVAGSHRGVPSTPRKCRGCSYWRVADSDYEAVCKVPRKLARSISCGPSSRYSASVVGGCVTGGGGDGEGVGENNNMEDSEEPASSLTLVPGSQDPSRSSDSDRTLAGRASSSPSIASLETTEEYIQPGAITDGQLSSHRELIDDRISDSFSEEHMGATHGQASPGPSLSLALCLLQSYAVYRPVLSSKGSKLPVLLRQSSSNGGSRLLFPDPVLGMCYGSPEGEQDNHMPTPELETPVFKLVDQDLNLAYMEDLLDDLYKEYPPPRPHQSLVEEQQSQLNQYECAASQCVSELQKAQLQVQSLQAKIHESEANNMKLQEKLSEMECELRSIRQAAQSQERTIQGLTESISTKDSEAQDLYQLMEGQNTTLCKLREMVHHNQLAQLKAPEGVSEYVMLAQLQAELVAVQSSLFSLGLELEASQRSLRQSQRQGDDLSRFKDRLNADLQEVQQYREVTEKHNQDLHSALQKTRSELQAKEAALKEAEVERHTVVQEKDRSITQLKHSLQDKEQQLQEYSEMLDSTGSSKPRDSLLEKLKERIKDRDRALELAIDDKFRCVEEREGQVRRLQLALREKERDLERLRCILSNNEETITSLDALVRGKELELEQAAEAYRNLQWLKQQSEEKERNTLREKDTIISQLQAALQTHSLEAQDLTATLVARVQAGPTEVVEELKARLALKEKLFQELLSDRSRQSNEHQAQVQEMLNTLSSKDQYLQDYAYRLSLVISERTGQLQELRRQLSSREQELCELKQDKEREMGGEAQHLQSLLKEKEAFIKELMLVQEEAMQPSSNESEAEMMALQEELQLVQKKEREAQKELSALRLSLAHQQDNKDSADHQCVLEQLVSEYNKLNDALRVEKRLYQNLTHMHTKSDSSENIQALHTELDSVQALRRQLEEVLARTRNMALTLERAAKKQPDFGELSTDEEGEEEEEEGDDEDGSSDEFTDSIEEDDDKVTARSLASIQARGAEGVIGPLVSQRADVKQLEDVRKTLEGQLEEIRSQLERDGYTSVAQMRSALQRLQQENQALKETRGQAGVVGLRTNPEWNHRSLNRAEEEDIEEDDKEEETFPKPVGKRGHPRVSLSDERGKRHCKGPRPLTPPQHTDQPETEVESAGDSSEEGALWHDIDEGLREQAARLSSDLALSHQENRELLERLMVSEATVHAQAEQLKDYRDLLTETSIQQASKQVQVDLQDLGYETCGRSENEAEREDASSPEFDDLEMCTSLSNQQDYEGADGSWFAGSSNAGAFEMEDESAPLQHLVQDLRSQLTGCHKVIRGLQLRVRSLSTTSDYASSLERTPRKVNWAFETSPAPSGVEEDEGWMSDTQGILSGSKPSRELQELMARVASLEAQLKSSRLEDKSQAEEGKCATWPGKYNSLIQAQARELSHLRQRIREGQGVSHILTQHLGDTTKAFEELLRANDIDYYMGQSFREQLAQNSALAQRVVAKISGRERAESHDDKKGHELLALRLSKELQQKDKIIESLHTKLQQRPETPSSCHALSETTDQSDRTSLVSDEYRTNEDLELSSDLDARDYQEEHGLQQPGQGSEQEVHPSILPPHGFLKSSSSCPNMHCSAPVGLTSQSSRALFSEPVSYSYSVPSGPDVWGKEDFSDPRPRALSVIAVRPELDTLYKLMNEQNRGFALPHDKAQFSHTSGAHIQHDLSSYSQQSHHAFQQYQLGGIPEGHSIKSDSGLVTGRSLWDMENMVPQVGGYSGSSGHQQGSSHAGVNLIEEHLREVRILRQRLEESIRTNDRLRLQLEERLASTGRGAPTNIYIQGLDTVTQLSNEIRILKEENLGLKSRLQASTDTCEEVVQLREAVFTACARLKQAELEAEQWKEELRRLQAHTQEQGQQIHILRQERQASQEKTNRLHHEVSLLQQQLCESRELIHSLQGELQVYDRVCSSTKANQSYLCELPGLPVELGELLGEVRSLRAQLQNSVQENSALKQLELHKQLEQKLGVGSPRTPSLSALTASPQRENFYRRQLLHDPAPSPPVRDIGLFNCGSPGPPYSYLDDSHSTANDLLEPHSELEGEAPDGSFANRNGRHAIGHVDDFSALQQQVLEGGSLVQRMETTLQACLGPPLLEGHQRQSSGPVLDYGCVKSLLSNTKTLRQILEEAMSLLKMFWRAALPSTDPSFQNIKKDQCMQEEILSLKLRMSEQDEVLKGTVHRLRSTSRTKENMEHFIVNQLSRTRDVLKKARTNLEKNRLRLSSLSSSPSSPYAAEDPGGAARDRPADCSFLKTSSASGAAANQRPAARKRSSQCLL
ncbi:LOW QUALITY PROTEIN: myomegalin-like [Cyclopterus lumpus]|uniref:LOW QUALITY PROTEIN: myomegalin-like n=1 Tax=Cyclopterus lumpus TaxID=8103 RepID=UPI0014873C25|nr:LOW QUALITY PROTEIN: myomegalin-like [Cyclopterus lumpus]